MTFKSFDLLMHDAYTADSTGRSFAHGWQEQSHIYRKKLPFLRLRGLTQSAESAIERNDFKSICF